jgi:hypothetical protein
MVDSQTVNICRKILKLEVRADHYLENMMTHSTENPWNSLIPDEWLETVEVPAMDQVVLGGFEGEAKNLGAAGRLRAKVTRFTWSPALPRDRRRPVLSEAYRPQ